MSWMRLRLVVLVLTIASTKVVQSQVVANVVGQLPFPVANNAVCEGFLGNVPYMFSFAGIDSTKSQVGIHLKSFRYNTVDNTSMTLPNLPDTMGKIGCAANRIGNIIYITGGYYVLPNLNEVSSNKMHRFDINANAFLSDGPNLPEATDDHVQVVWRDSLLILITGWQNSGNISNVQIFDPSLNTWQVGTPVPSNNLYRSFGSSGVVLNNTIYYFGGASSGAGFNAQNVLRKGVIDHLNPTQITWTNSTLFPTQVTKYRSAATTVGHSIHWIGGSQTTYNYDGIAYNGSGGVTSSNSVMYTNTNLGPWTVVSLPEVPMDLRGIANTSETVKYIAGGMIGNQEVTNNVYRLTWDPVLNIAEGVEEYHDINIYPNPMSSEFTIHFGVINAAVAYTIFTMDGKVLKSGSVKSENETIGMHEFQKGSYLVVLKLEDGSIYHQNIIKR
ncbi:hypothetical protein DNU06_10800 [Putridiphycobacter roseus]|uniref:Secretion system C-terminal sorting domain-containing protein n=1 Tax=Putridiphycobacter roseus TaxID=2219161 RepID=A0A2W1N1D1_9FLAO|nr:T9SS C-terminal target domain-containing protein [Putridiphycobacter roseus]PZE16741.1 hypothetical protein DNU06_10800 [Putridiphycobacter roseus]